MKKNIDEYNSRQGKTIFILLIILIILSIIYIFKTLLIGKEAEEESMLLNEIEIKEENISYKKVKVDEKEKKKIESGERIAKVKELQKQNKDIIGWIEIKGTKINYPVLQGSDNEYYMSHNYKKEKSEKGSIFLDYRYNLEKSSTNLLIYGHNIITGELFKDLLKYSKRDFYETHPIIRLTTSKEDMEFEIISVLKTKVYSINENNVFKYYQFINAKDKDEYNEFVKNAKENSLYETGIEAEYGDRLITLSTCSYHTDNGRFAVIGRKKEE